VNKNLERPVSTATLVKRELHRPYANIATSRAERNSNLGQLQGRGATEGSTVLVSSLVELGKVPSALRQSKQEITPY